MLPKINILLFVSLIVMTLPGCFKDKIVGEFYLTDEMKSQNPYIDGQTINFTNSSGEFFVCDVNKYDEINNSLVSSNTSNYYLWEKETTTLHSDSISLQIKMHYEPNREPLINLSAWYNDSSIEVFDKPLPITYGTTARVASLEVNGVWYYQVYYFENDFFPNSKIYYSTEFGVLRVEFENGEFLDFVGE